MEFLIFSSKTPAGKTKVVTSVALIGWLLIALLCQAQAGEGVSKPAVSTNPSTTDQSWTTGVWGSWSSWSDCSRTCGRGVSTQTRECLQGSGYLRHRRIRHNPIHGNREPPDEKRCLGVYRRFLLCENRTCSTTVDMRKEQCSAFNKNPFHGQVYNWEPFLIDSEHCELRCRPVGHKFYATLAKVVEDGTPCNSSPDDDRICVAGQCKVVGCDGVIGSTSRFDQCGVCGGNNSICHRVSGLYTQSPLPIGYNLITIIPKGAFNINVTEMNRGRNYLALRREDGNYVISSNWSISRPGDYRAAGTIFSYRRHDDNSGGNEALYAKGPTTEVVELMLIYHHRNPGVSYAYSLPLKNKKKDVDLKNVSSSPVRRITLPGATPQETNDLARLPLPLNRPNLSKRTNSGVGRSRTPKRSHPEKPTVFSRAPRPRPRNPWNHRPRIRPSKTKDIPPEPLVQPRISKPKTVEVLNDVGFTGSTGRSVSADGNYFWNVAGFGVCNQTCGIGYSEAQVKCFRQDRLSLVEEHFCQGLIKPIQPPIACNRNPCPPGWTVGVWSSCSATCGEGKQIRKVACAQRISPTSLVPASEELCSKQETRPVETKECKRKECSKWHTSLWSLCTANCGKGRRHRKVLCMSGVNDVTDDVSCPLPKPDDEETCFTKACDESQWMSTEWKRCSSLCGPGNQTRRVACINGNSKTPHESCDRNQRPSEIRACGQEELTRKNNEKCRRGKWFSGPWDECSSNCGLGSQTREVLCMSTNKGGGWQIDNAAICWDTEKPVSKQKCTGAISCEEWYAGEWSTCTRSCGSGEQSRGVVCLDSAQGDKCPEATKPTLKQPCNTQPCPDSLQGDVSSSHEHTDSGCTNKWSNCRLAVQARLCQTQHYRDLCCHSCKQKNTTATSRWQASREKH